MLILIMIDNYRTVLELRILRYLLMMYFRLFRLFRIILLAFGTKI